MMSVTVEELSRYRELVRTNHGPGSPDEVSVFVMKGKR